MLYQVRITISVSKILHFMEFIAERRRENLNFMYVTYKTTCFKLSVCELKIIISGIYAGQFVLTSPKLNMLIV